MSRHTQTGEIVNQSNFSNRSVIQMVQSATGAMGRSYNRYTEFSVGAAVLTKNGKVFSGSNVELGGCNSIHAETMALCNAVTSGSPNLEAIAVATETEVPCIPCGSCLDAMKTFEEDMAIYCRLGSGDWYITSLDTELPNAYNSNREV